ncbi:MAG: hypothetical protein ACKESB_00435 [Candidatus Hodgkinia cicadicola]
MHSLEGGLSTFKKQPQQAVVGETYVAIEPLTRGLAESCEVTTQQQLATGRTGALAVHCASGQWYIKINNDARTRVCGMLTSVKFVPPSAASSWSLWALDQIESFLDRGREEYLCVF